MNRSSRIYVAGHTGLAGSAIVARQSAHLSRLVEQRMLMIYSEDAAARQLILAQHGLTEVTQADRQHDLELGALMHTVFARHFQLARHTAPPDRQDDARRRI